MCNLYSITTNQEAIRSYRQILVTAGAGQAAAVVG